MDRESYVYILAKKKDGTLYVGSTQEIIKRIFEHKNGFVPSFTRRYGIKLLVYYEIHQDIYAARLRERQLKKWNRAWKVRLIHSLNPEWLDLYDSLLG